MSLLIKWCKNITKEDGTLDFVIAYVKEKLTQFFSIIFCEYYFHYTWSKSCLRATGQAIVSFQAKEDESISHVLNTQFFPSSAAFSFPAQGNFCCPAQVEGMKTPKTNCLFNS